MALNVNRTSPAREAHRDIMRGVKLKDILEYLVEQKGWEWMAERIDVQCFKVRPTIKSSRKYLRNTVWALDKVEVLYVECKLIEAKLTKVKPEEVKSEEVKPQEGTPEEVKSAE